MEKLNNQGLGPAPLGFSVVKEISDDVGLLSGCAAGVIVENIYKLKTKVDAKETDLTQAGVITDKINSAIRQQIRGYVSDLNSVVSARLIEPESRVDSLANMLKMALFT